MGALVQKSRRLLQRRCPMSEYDCLVREKRPYQQPHRSIIGYGPQTRNSSMLLLTGKHTKLEEQMLTIRLLEDRLQVLCDQGLGTDLHFSRGQEAISVGVMAALRESDYVVTHHRTIAHAVARGEIGRAAWR